MLRYLAEVSPRTASTDELFAAVVRRLLERHISVSGVTMQTVREACEGLRQSKDGNWALPAGFASLAHYEPVNSPFGCLASEYASDKALLAFNERPPKSATAFSAELVEGRRNTELYNAHSYHTKVPPEAIIPFLEHYTRKGDVVLDPFAGSGMTGVAAAMSGRRAILNDLSVAASHLAYNHTRPCDHQRLMVTFGELYERVRPNFEKLYETKNERGERGYAMYTLWSRDARCPKCSGTFSVWDIIDRDTGRMQASIACPLCRAPLGKQALKYEGNRPVLVSYETSERKRMERAPSEWDLKHIRSFRREDVADWYPDVLVGADREMFIRSALHLQSISTVADFTARNLTALHCTLARSTR
ncbi:MAG: site-specific DNA-methyltransferase [Dehalococcoidia bacterium]|nr:site-specific DNA-methyltransferase [Dehalococcoidia bacterium]